MSRLRVRSLNGASGSPRVQRGPSTIRGGSNKSLRLCLAPQHLSPCVPQARRPSCRDHQTPPHRRLATGTSTTLLITSSSQVGSLSTSWGAGPRGRRGPGPLCTTGLLCASARPRAAARVSDRGRRDTPRLLHRGLRLEDPRPSSPRVVARIVDGVSGAPTTAGRCHGYGAPLQADAAASQELRLSQRAQMCDVSSDSTRPSLAPGSTAPRPGARAPTPPLWTTMWAGAK
ncbi:hypothetical protein NDU88_003775 [Pleurodeles waltl]|uniref:Uncharacterized protein n=1 Tax=Pleurodeles waltl TaxID=8319 RepID=A0AAV7VIS2_PLEWA|nr:hypothetical protein NDU88_003775 [Pleurodeles waltl]